MQFRVFEFEKVFFQQNVDISVTLASRFRGYLQCYFRLKIRLLSLLPIFVFFRYPPIYRRLSI